MAALATVAQLAARVGEPITEPADIALAESVLGEASENVRFHGRTPWPYASDAPAMAIAITVAAASRGYQNPAGFDMERGDMVTFNRGKNYTVGCELTVGEINQLRTLAGGGGLRSVPLSNPTLPVPRSRSDEPCDRGYAPLNGGITNKPFPLGYC